MVSALMLHLVQWILAYLALDSLFRRLSMEPEGLRQRLGRARSRFALTALLSGAAVGAAQVWLGGWWGAPPALVGWLPWWLLWRFGWRKQLTHLYKEDGGRDLPIE